MTLYRTELLLVGDGSVRRGVDVAADDGGTIVEIAPIGAIRAGVSRRRDAQVLMPGVVNAHTHLTDAEIESPVPGGDGLPAWVRRLLDHRIRRPGPEQSISVSSVADVLRRMRDAGTVAIGEVSNGTATLEPVLQSGMLTRYIQEVLGFARDRAEPAMRRAIEVEQEGRWNDNVRPTFGIHAPYSVSPELAARIIGHNTRCGRITYEHLAEDPAERELYETGGGPWREYLEEIGAWDSTWRAPGESALAHYERLGLLGPNLAAVHLADATAEEIALVAARGVRVILSPTSNVHIGNRVPPLAEIVRRDIPFALGTDGRGSNPSVDVFDEARLLAERFEWIDGMLLLRALTTSGAAVLGISGIGVIEPGMRPGLIAVELDSLSGSDSDIARRIVLEPNSRRRIL